MTQHPWHNLDLGKDAPKVVQAVIEIPANSIHKYELDKKSGMLVLDRMMHSSVIYPGDYGFLPQTLCDDKDPLDVIVYTRAPVLPLTLVPVRILGCFRMVDDGEEDDKLIGVYDCDPFMKDIKEVKDLPSLFLKQVREFFLTYKRLKTDKPVEVGEIQDKDAAFKLIKVSQEMYAEQYGKK